MMPGSEAAPHLVVIDDDDAHLAMLVTCLTRAGYRATGFARSRDGLQYLLDNPASLAVIDLCMPEMDGIELVRRLQVSVPALQLIGISGARDPQARIYLRALEEFGARVALRKPVAPERLLAAVREALHGAPAAAVTG